MAQKLHRNPVQIPSATQERMGEALAELKHRELIYNRDTKELGIKIDNELIIPKPKVDGLNITYDDDDQITLKNDILIGSVTTQPEDGFPWKSQYVLFDSTDTTILLTKESAANQQDENSIIGGEVLIKFSREDGTFKTAHYKISLSSTGSYSLEGATGTVDNVEVVRVERDGVGYYGLKMPNDVYQVMKTSVETYYEFTKRTETQEWVENAVNDTRENITDNYTIKILDTRNPNSLVLVNKSTNAQIPLSMVYNVTKPLLVHKTVYLVINGTIEEPQVNIIGSDANGNDMNVAFTRRDGIPANGGCFWFSMTMGNYRNITQMPLVTGTNLDLFDNNAYIWFEIYLSAANEFSIDRAYITRTNQTTVAGVMSEGRIWRSAQHAGYYDNTDGTAPLEGGVPATDKSYIDCSVGFVLSEYFNEWGGDFPFTFGQRMVFYQFDLPAGGNSDTFNWYYTPIRYLLDDRGKGIYESAELKNWYDNDYYLYLNIYYKEYNAQTTAYVGCKEGYICNTNGNHNPQTEPGIVVQYLPFANINDVADTIKNFFTTAGTTTIYLSYTRSGASYYIDNSTFYLSSANNTITLNNGYKPDNNIYTRWQYYLFDDFVRQLDIPILGSSLAQYFGKGYYLWILVYKNNQNTHISQVLISQMAATGDRPAAPYIMGFTAVGNTGNEAYGQVVSFGTLFRATQNVNFAQGNPVALMTLINLLPYPAQLSQADFETGFMNINYVVGGLEDTIINRSRVINLYDRTQNTRNVEGYSQSWDFYLKRTSGWDFYISRNNGNLNPNEDIKLDFTDGYAQSGTFRYSCSLDSLLNLCDGMKGNGNLADYYGKGYNLLFEITRQDVVNNWDPTLKDVIISVINGTDNWFYINPAFEDSDNGVSMGINSNSYFFTITERGEEYEETSNPFAKYKGWLTGWYHVPEELKV